MAGFRLLDSILSDYVHHRFIEDTQLLSNYEVLGLQAVIIEHLKKSQKKVFGDTDKEGELNRSQIKEENERKREELKKERKERRKKEV